MVPEVLLGSDVLLCGVYRANWNVPGKGASTLPSLKRGASGKQQKGKEN